ncbi:(S)-ureidoglycine aminohydrolase-like [Hevea brasiliensis]|uniref:(S)-ureidoglycine aminohydrolase-like n=1 Tax=Hevea brasiliensis TaxID=3981 RepID=UPI0025D20C11|nr:(S)-ureidoglycine aminohydrolase-like [Hevea brasiliensis]
MEGFCSAPSVFDAGEESKPLYWKVTNPTMSTSHLQGQYFSELGNIKISWLWILRERWFEFVNSSMTLAELGSVTLTNTSSAGHKLTVRVSGIHSLTAYERKLATFVDSYAYLPPNFEHSVKCDVSPTLVVFEKRYASLDNLITKQILGSTDKQLLLETPVEQLRI